MYMARTPPNWFEFALTCWAKSLKVVPGELDKLKGSSLTSSPLLPISANRKDKADIFLLPPFVVSYRTLPIFLLVVGAISYTYCSFPLLPKVSFWFLISPVKSLFPPNVDLSAISSKSSSKALISFCNSILSLWLIVSETALRALTLTTLRIFNCSSIALSATKSIASVAFVLRISEDIALICEEEEVWLKEEVIPSA